MKAEYLATLERQSAWARSSEKSLYSDEGWRALLPGFPDVSRRDAVCEPLRAREVIWVAPEVCRLVVSASASLPDATFARALVPVAPAMVFLAAPFIIEDEPGLRLDALGWQWVGQDLVLVGYEDLEAELSRPAFVPVTRAALREGHSCRSAEVQWQEIRAKVPSADWQDARLVFASVRLTISLLLFMDQRLVGVHRVAPPRAMRRRLARAGHEPGHVKVITLRRSLDESDEHEQREHEQRKVDWRGPWTVREHDRRHPRTGEKTVRVRSYTKGPKDKPLKDDQRRIFAVVR